jgi:hypothetical protein
VAVDQCGRDVLSPDVHFLGACVAFSHAHDQALMNGHIPLLDLSGKDIDHPALLEDQIRGDQPASGLDSLLQEFNTLFVVHRALSKAGFSRWRKRLIE